MNATTTPRIYVACLASYNNGILYGKWLDVPADADELREEINDILRGSPCPNIEKRDHECTHCGYEWSSQVEYSESSPAISGEKMEFCPKCNKGGVSSSPRYTSAEEWAIHDFEGFGGWKIGEYEDLENLCQYAEIVEELDGVELEAFQAWIANDNSNTPVDSDSLDNFRENYRGCWGSLADYVENYWEECGEYKNDSNNWWSPINYIDWARMAHDLELSGDVWTHDGSEGIHVFDNH